MIIRVGIKVFSSCKTFSAFFAFEFIYFVQISKNSFVIKNLLFNFMNYFSRLWLQILFVSLQRCGSFSFFRKQSFSFHIVILIYLIYLYYIRGIIQINILVELLLLHNIFIIDILFHNSFIIFLFLLFLN